MVRAVGAAGGVGRVGRVVVGRRLLVLDVGHRRGLRLAPAAEREEEQERRFRQRIDDPVRQWKLSPMDLESYRRWWDYTRAYDEMIRLTDTPHAPWWIVDSNDKKAARINCLTHLLASIPYEKVKYDAPKLGKRQKRPDDHVADRTARNVVPAVF